MQHLWLFHFQRVSATLIKYYYQTHCKMKKIPVLCVGCSFLGRENKYHSILRFLQISICTHANGELSWDFHVFIYKSRTQFVPVSRKVICVLHPFPWHSIQRFTQNIFKRKEERLLWLHFPFTIPQLKHVYIVLL